MLEIEKGYNLFIRGRIGTVLTVVVQEVPAGSVEVDENAVRIRLTKPRRTLFEGALAQPSIIRALLERDNDDDSGFIFLDEFTNDIEVVREALEKAITLCIPDEAEDREEAVAKILADMLTEVAAQEAYFQVQDRATAAANN
jgi:hypothetical protein